MILLNGQVLRNAFISGANHIANQRQQVDALNVFPVPDGDTGTNMSMTMNAARRELELIRADASVAEISKTTAGALLRGARGNSGVILSLLFRGFARGMEGKEEASASDLVQALGMGVEAAYKAVMKPTEGTILTVARLAVEQTRRTLDEAEAELSAAEVFDAIVKFSADTLEKTPDMLPVLKKAGVVDAGGKGLLVIFEGMQNVISGGAAVEQAEQPEPVYTHSEPIYNAAGEYDGEITFTYCTEFIVLKDESERDALTLRAYLESIGDSVVVVDDDSIIKCHVHTDNPGDAIQNALQYGPLTSLKIENMREQHRVQKATVAKSGGFSYMPVDTSRECGFVAVCTGEGIRTLFTDLGVDNIVSGGQTMNPSTENILDAIHATPAKTVFVLPNNKNIIMAAEQTVKLADRSVRVLQTRTIPQGLSAMMAYSPDLPLDANQLAMTKAYERVETGQVTFAARDSNFDGHAIKAGELLALENGKLSFTEKSLEKAVLKLSRSLAKAKDVSFLTLIYGADVNSTEAETMLQLVREKISDDIEVSLLPGGQSVYYYIISAE